MARFLVRRALWFVATVWIVLTLSFVLLRSVRGGPFSSERALHPAVEQALAERYHLDWPLWKQYLQFLGPLNLGPRGPRFLGGDGSAPTAGLLSGDFGPSFKYRDFTVNEVLAQSLPISATLGALALSWAVLFGLAAGVLAAARHGQGLDLALRLVTTLGVALPNFVVAGLLVLAFAFGLHLFPPAGWGDLRHYCLPALALGTPCAAYVARLTRAGMLEVLSADYIRTARAKGLAPRLVFVRHALRAGVLPVVSYLGPAAAGILTGSLVIEKIFAIPGAGTHFVNSALNRDYPLALGVTLVYTVLVYALNLVVDVAYTLLDPRIQLEEAR